MADDERRVLGSGYDSDANAGYTPCEENEESDVYISDPNGYSSEEWNKEFVDGQRIEREQRQQVYVDDEGENILDAHRGKRYDPRCPIDSITFELGMEFESPSEFKAAVKNYAIWNGFNVMFLKSCKKNTEVVCEEHCPWRIYASWGPTRETFVVKVLNDEHRCSRALKNRQADYHWIANHFLEKFRIDMNWKVVDMMREINEQFGIIVSRRTCYRAKSAAHMMLQGSLKKQLGKPKQKRSIDISEKELSGQRLSKKGIQMKCSLCHQVGHNRKTCAQRRIQVVGEGSQGAIELPRTEVDEVYQPMIVVPRQVFEPIQQPSQQGPTPTPTETGQCSLSKINNF